MTSLTTDAFLSGRAWSDDRRTTVALVSGFRLGETEATTMSSVDTIMNDQGLVDSAGVESVPALLTAKGKGHRRKGTKAADRRRGRTGSRGSLGQGQGRVGRGG